MKTYFVAPVCSLACRNSPFLSERLCRMSSFSRSRSVFSAKRQNTTRLLAMGYVPPCTKRRKQNVLNLERQRQLSLRAGTLAVQNAVQFNSLDEGYSPFNIPITNHAMTQYRRLLKRIAPLRITPK